MKLLCDGATKMHAMISTVFFSIFFEASFCCDNFDDFVVSSLLALGWFANF